MKCPYCNHKEDRVIDSRPSDDGTTIRRRRECLSCKQRFTTYEKVETMPIIVIKKDGSRQPFDREKLIRGIMKSCVKRPVTISQIEQLVDRIEGHYSNQLRREIPSDEIGEEVMERLRHIDEVAYIRFVSVYREFEDLQSFINEVKGLKERGDKNGGR